MKSSTSPYGIPILNLGPAVPKGAVAGPPGGNPPLGTVTACRWIGASLVLMLALASCLSAAQFDIRQYGATPNDPSDDTQAIRKALEACATAGSTLHVEHARGLTGVILADNRCRHSILAGGVDGLMIRGNLVTGRIVGNYDCNTLVQGGLVRDNLVEPAAGRPLVLTNRCERVTVVKRDQD